MSFHLCKLSRSMRLGTGCLSGGLWANVEQDSNTDKAHRATSLGNGQCTWAGVLLQMSERPCGGKDRKWRGFGGLELSQLASALPKFSSSLICSPRAGVGDFLHVRMMCWLEGKGCQTMASYVCVVDLCSCGDLEGFMVKAYQKRKITCLFLMAVSCCIIPCCPQ